MGLDNRNLNMSKLVLFDIDQTLLESSRGHHKAFEIALREVFGIEVTVNRFEHGGMTDRQIIAELMRLEGVTDKAIESRLDPCIRVMEKAYAELLKDDELIVLRGVPELLEALGHQPTVLMGLVTGNLETIAWGKLRKVGLAKYFKLGGFGNEDVIRTHLVENAIQRAIQHQGFVRANNVYVFGDTPLDVSAGHDAKATTVGVATGRFSKSDLKRAGADWALSSLEELDNIFSILDL